MQESKLSAICEKVFDRCLAPAVGGEGCDNMTMIIVQFKKPINPSLGQQSLASAQRSESNTTAVKIGEGSKEIKE